MPTKLKQILLSSDVMIFPSLADGFGFAVLEAMACGVVPICSRNAGISDIIENGKNGFVVDAANANAIFEKMLLLKKDCTLLHKLSKNAVESAAQMCWINYYASIGKMVQIITAMHMKEGNL